MKNSTFGNIVKGAIIGIVITDIFMRGEVHRKIFSMIPDNVKTAVEDTVK